MRRRVGEVGREALPRQKETEGYSLFGLRASARISFRTPFSRLHQHVSVNIKRFASAVCSDWRTENCCNWGPVTTIREAKSPVRIRNMRESFVWHGRRALSLLNQLLRCKSVAVQCGICGRSDDSLLQLVTGTGILVSSPYPRVSSSVRHGVTGSAILRHGQVPICVRHLLFP
jgi:hypothetical protein